MSKSKYLEVGKIVTTHGIKGEVRVQPWCDSPGELAGLERLYFDGGKTGVIVESARVHKNVVVIKIGGVETVEAAAALRDKVVYAARSDFSLPDGRYFVADLLGMEIVDNESGEIYGRLTDVLQYGAADVYEVTGEGGSGNRKLLVPATGEVVAKKDFDLEKIYINMPDGLIEAEREGGKA